MPRIILLILTLLWPISGALAAQNVITLDNPNVASPVWILPDDTTNVISAQITFEGGITSDPVGKEGLGNLLGGLMLSGAGERDAAALAQTLKDHAITISVQSRRDDTILSLTAPARYWAETAKLVADIIRRPRFDTGEVIRAIAAQSASIRSDLSDPDWRAMRLMNGIVYEGAPYARPGAGSLKSLNRLTRNDFITAHKTIFGSKPVQAVFVGDVDNVKITTMLSAFDGLATPAKSAISEMRHWQGEKAYHQRFDVPQTSLYYILPSLPTDDPDYATLAVLNAVLSDGFGSRLMKALREESGLSYGASGGTVDARGGSLWVFSVRVPDAKLDQAADILRREVRETASETLPKTEIDAAAQSLAAQLPLGWTSSPAIAGQLAEAQRKGYGTDYLAMWQKRLLDVTPEAVQKLAQRLLRTENSVMIAVGRTRPEGWDDRPDLPNME